MHLLDLQGSALQPDPKAGPKKSLCGDMKGSGPRLQHQASLSALPCGWVDVSDRVSRTGTST